VVLLTQLDELFAGNTTIAEQAALSLAHQRTH